ncbi:MAG: MFS transporter [Anaerolineales bacterium]
MTSDSSLARRDPYAALRHPDFRLLLTGRFIASFGMEILSFAIGWELWLRTKEAFILGLVGLVQVVPVVFLSLHAGHVADQFNRRRTVALAQTLTGISALGLAYLSYTEGSLALIFLCLFGVGVARAYNDPALSALVPETVPASLFSSAATWNSSAWQTASIMGPAAAGAVVAWLHQVSVLYIVEAFFVFSFIIFVALMQSKPLPLAKKAETWESLREGLRFVRGNKIILSAITLDMFAVLFGGAVALLPIYATDILKVGADGLGIMRAAPSIGALLMAFALAHLPPMKNAGRALLWAVAGFGAATVVFGLSIWFWLSVAMLALLGGLDNISVVIRATLLLTQPPNEMRGRVSSVNSIFIGISNELGSFESGFAAALFGPVFAVVGGGIITVLVVLASSKIFPELTALKTLDAPEQA